MGLAVEPDRKCRHDAIDIPLLASMVHPWASQEGLDLAHDWLAWLFEFDDRLDEGAAGFDANAARLEGQCLLEILLDKEPRCYDSPLALAMQDIWRRLLPATQPAWRDRFRKHVAEYLFANVWESENRMQQRCPTAGEYLEHRQHTGAVHPCFDLLLPLSNITDIRSSLWRCNRLRHLEYIACEIITLANDLVSFPKESVAGALHNLVTILMVHDGCSETEAMHQVAERIARLMNSFARQGAEAKGRLSGRCSGLDLYVEGLRHWIVGNFAWSMRSGRFQSAPDRMPSGLQAHALTRMV
jgi:hypothetical protein